MIDINSAFQTTGEPINVLFNQPGVGFYIPLYQRPYSWDRENIEQLMEDLMNGVEELVDDDDSIRFLGTIIAIPDKNKDQINPKDPRGLPTEVQIIIDGQQRISTIALLGTVLDAEIRRLTKKLPDEAPYDELKQHAGVLLTDLRELYALNLKRGTPELKPKVIRGQDDTWTFNGPDDFYKSSVANYLARYIRYLDEREGEPPKPKDKLVRSNLSNMRKAIRQVIAAHEPDSDLNGKYPTGDRLVDKIKQEYLWAYERPKLADLARQAETHPEAPAYYVAALAQLFAFAHYLTRRCCVTIIKPQNEDWAFDMFQSLNATGTPLTAIETFKPRVVQFERGEGDGYQKSGSESHFMRIDKFLDQAKTAPEKGKLTNRLLVAYALAWDGTKLASRFSEQRKWLQRAYEKQQDAEAKRKFIECFANTADFFRKVWEGYRGPAPLASIAGHAEADGVSACLLYLKDSNHRIAPSVLSRYYEPLLKDEKSTEDVDRFVSAVKAVAAFYTLWRATRSNSGLDAVYRTLMRGTDDRTGLAWSMSPGSPDVEALREYFRDVLKRYDLAEREEWLAKTPGGLTYERAKIICRFCLLIAAHDTIPDGAHIGLMKRGRSGCAPYLKPDAWTNASLKELEHIAPVSPPDGHDWDEQLYAEDAYHMIGNLTLLPREINASAGNKGFREKLLYYQHLGVADPEQIECLRTEAETAGIELATETISLLTESKYQAHLQPVTQLPAEHTWDVAFVRERTRRISEIVWDRIAPWLGL